MTGSKWEVPGAPSLGSINLLEQLIELRDTFTYVYQFIRKDTDEAHRARCGDRGKGVALACLLWIAAVPTSLRVPQPGSSLNPILLGFY